MAHQQALQPQSAGRLKEEVVIPEFYGLSYSTHHRLVEEDARVHGLEVGRHDDIRLDLVQNIPLKVHAGRYFDQGQMVVAHLEYGPFRYVEDVSAAFGGIRAVENSTARPAARPS